MRQNILLNHTLYQKAVFSSNSKSNFDDFGSNFVNCLRWRDAETPFPDQFFTCLLEHFRSKPKDMAEVASSSSVFKTFLLTKAYSSVYISSDVVDWVKVFSGNVWKIPASAFDVDTFANAIISHIISNSAMGVTTAPSIENTKSMITNFKNDMAGYIQLQKVHADSTKKYPRITPGPTFSVNIAGHYRKNDYEASVFYRHNLQNIYENPFYGSSNPYFGSKDDGTRWTHPGLGGLGKTNDDLTSKQIKKAKFIGNYLGTVKCLILNVNYPCSIEHQAGARNNKLTLIDPF